jgi:Tol biopolymer transport system component/DNA-binding winged helix-turn-helix (wHTH) protein
MLNFGIVGAPIQPGTAASRSYRFGVFEFDLRVGELRRNGLKVKLQEQPLQVLTLLLDKPGEIVTREDLRNRLWPADTFVDFDHSLNAAIRRLRDALGDSAENPRFVETVARRGYRFLSPVSVLPSNGNGGIGAASAVSEIPASPTPRFHKWWMLAGAAAVVLVLLGIRVGFFLGRSRPANPANPPRVSRLTANPADDGVRAAAISRDGKYLAYADETGFYLRQISTGETHPMWLPAGLKAGSLSWFPDGAHMIVALTGSTQASSLWEISTLGGTPRRLSDDGRLPAVSPDGSEIAFITGPRMSNQIWLMAADGEQPRKLGGEDGDLVGALAWSPDGTKIAYLRGRLAYSYGVSGAIEFVDVRNRQVSRLLQLNSTGWFAAVDVPLVWTPDQHLIYTLAEPPPRQLDSNLWSVGLDPGGHLTGTPLRLTSDPGSVSSISASGDGKRIVYVKGVPQPDVYVARLKGSEAISEPVRLTLDDRQDLPFDWTPDGEGVLFISDRTGIFSIYRQPIDQMVPELLVGGSHPVLTARLSPDGSQLLYLVYPNWSEHASSIPLMRVPLGGGAPQQVLQADWITNQQCARAPATLCLYSVVTNGKFTLMSFDPLKGSGTQVYQVKDELPQLYNWSLSPDGSTVALARGKQGDEEPQIRLVSLSNGAEKSMTIQGWTGVAAVDWAADGKTLWATSAHDDESVLLNIDLQGRARVVWRPGKMSVRWAIPSRDGKYLALHVSSTSANAWMVERP